MNSNINYQSVSSTQLYLNSANANIYLNKSKKSNVVFFFSNILKIDKNSIDMKLSVVNAQIPVSWYLINDTNNTITITIQNITNSYNFPAGNYNVNTFMSAWLAFFGNTWVITFNNVTNKLTFSHPLGQITFGNTIISKNLLLSVMGLDPSQSYTSSGNYITSQYSVNFSGLQTLKIKSSTFSFKNIDSFSGSATSTICSIPVSSTTMINYYNLTGYKSTFKNYELNSIDIAITDDKNNFIDFSDIDWSLTLQIDITNETIENIDNLNDIYLNQHQEL